MPKVQWQAQMLYVGFLASLVVMTWPAVHSASFFHPHQIDRGYALSLLLATVCLAVILPSGVKFSNVTLAIFLSFPVTIFLFFGGMLDGQNILFLYAAALLAGGLFVLTARLQLPYITVLLCLVYLALVAGILLHWGVSIPLLWAHIGLMALVGPAVLARNLWLGGRQHVQTFDDS